MLEHYSLHQDLQAPRPALICRQARPSLLRTVLPPPLPPLCAQPARVRSVRGLVGLVGATLPSCHPTGFCLTQRLSYCHRLQFPGRSSLRRPPAPCATCFQPRPPRPSSPDAVPLLCSALLCWAFRFPTAGRPLSPHSLPAPGTGHPVLLPLCDPMSSRSQRSFCDLPSPSCFVWGWSLCGSLFQGKVMTTAVCLLPQC